MENNYSDQKMKQILESPPDFQPSPQDIEDMRKRLQTLPKPSQKRGAFLWWPWLFLPLLLGMGYLGWRLYHLDQSYEMLVQRVETNQFRQVDTLVQQETIYHIDTIYRTVYETTVREVIVSEIPGSWRANTDFLPSRNSLTAPIFSGPITALERSDWMSSSSLGQYAMQKQRASSGTDPSTSGMFPEDLSIPPTNSLAWAPEKESIIQWNAFSGGLANMLDSKEEDRNWGPKPAYFLQPNAYRLGVSGRPLSIPTHSYGGSTGAAGLVAALDFPAGQSLEIGAEWLLSRYENKEPSTFGEYPDMQPNDASDVLYEIKDYGQYLQVPLRLSQRFRLEKAFQPRISLGMVAYRPLRHRLVYEYLTAAGEVKLEQTTSGSSFRADQLELGIGASWSIWKNWRLQSDFRFNQSLSTHPDDYVPLGFWNLHLGVQRVFAKK